MTPGRNPSIRASALLDKIEHCSDAFRILEVDRDCGCGYDSSRSLVGVDADMLHRRHALPCARSRMMSAPRSASNMRGERSWPETGDFDDADSFERTLHSRCLVEHGRAFLDERAHSFLEIICMRRKLPNDSASRASWASSELCSDTFISSLARRTLSRAWRQFSLTSSLNLGIELLGMALRARRARSPGPRAQSTRSPKNASSLALRTPTNRGR